MVALTLYAARRMLVHRFIVIPLRPHCSSRTWNVSTMRGGLLCQESQHRTEQESTLQLTTANLACRGTFFEGQLHYAQVLLKVDPCKRMASIRVTTKLSTKFLQQ